MYAGSYQGNGCFCFSLELNGYCPALCWFCLCACICTREVPVEPACVHMCKCVRALSVKKGSARANWISQEAGLESDLISLMCDQCEWEPGAPKASVATQLRRLQTAS